MICPLVVLVLDGVADRGQAVRAAMIDVLDAPFFASGSRSWNPTSQASVSIRAARRSKSV